MEKHVLKESWYSWALVSKINLKVKIIIRILKIHHKKIIKGIINQEAIIIPNPIHPILYGLKICR